MPRSRNLSHYPSRYGEIIRECGVGGATITVPFDDMQHALSMRGHFYAYVGALKGEARKLKSQPRNYTPGEQDILELAAQSEMVMVAAIESPAGGYECRWQNRERSWQAQALARAVVTPGDSSPTTSNALEDIASRLMRVQRETTEGDGNGQ